MNRHTCPALVVFLLLLSGISWGQQSTPPPVSDDVGKDDILILINLTADELIFDTVPNATVEFPGKPERTTIWVTQRQNLPDKVEPGVTYRNIGLQLTISTRFAEIDRIVREALGQPTPTGTVAADPNVQSPPQPTTAQPPPSPPQQQQPPNKTPARPPL